MPVKKPPPRKPKGAGSLGRRSDGTFRPYVTENGKRTTLGTFHSEDAAKTALEKRLAVRPGQAASPAEERARTFEVVLLDALEHPAPDANTSTAKQYDMRWHLDRGYLDGIKRMSLRSIAPGDVYEVFRELAETVSPKTGKPLGKATIRNVKATINAVFAHARWRRWREDNPAENVSFTVKEPKRDLLPSDVDDDGDRSRRAVKYTQEEAEALLAAMAASRWYPRWLLAFRYGVRPAEALGLTDEDWNSANRTLRIRRALVVKKLTPPEDDDAFLMRESPLTVADLKTAGSRRTIKLDSELGALIDDWIVRRNEEVGKLPRAEVAVEDSTRKYRYRFLWTQLPRGGEVPPLTPGLDEDEWARISASALVKVPRYSLRHHALSTLVEKYPLPAVARVAGHEDINMIIEHYLHATDSEVADISSVYEPVED